MCETRSTCEIASAFAVSPPTLWWSLRRSRRASMIWLPKGRFGSHSHAHSFINALNYLQRWVSVLVSLRRKERFSEVNSSDDEKFLVPSLLCNSRSRRRRDSDLELLHLLAFNLFCYRDRLNGRLSILRLRLFRVSRLSIFFNLPPASKDELHVNSGIPFQNHLFRYSEILHHATSVDVWVHVLFDEPRHGSCEQLIVYHLLHNIVREPIRLQASCGALWHDVVSSPTAE